MTTTTDDDDRQLLAAFAGGGDEAAFAGLVQRHGPMVAGVCRRILRGPSDADDAAQAVFLTLARKASSMLSHPDLAGWLHRCATNIARRQRDAERIRRGHERAAPPPVAPRADDREAAAALDEAIASLPEDYRVPLVLHHLEGCTQETVARRLRVAPGTIAWRLHRARELLQRALARRGVAVAAVAGVLAGASAGASEAALDGIAGAAVAARGGTAGAVGASPRAWQWAQAGAPARGALWTGAATAAAVALSLAAWAMTVGGERRAVAPAPAAGASPAGDAEPELDAAECWRRAIAALPPAIGTDQERSEDARSGRPSADARNILATAPEVLRWWRLGAARADYRQTEALGMRDQVVMHLDRVEAAAFAALDAVIAADGPDAIAQATMLMHAGGQFATAGNSPWVFDHGIHLQWQLTTVLACRVDGLSPERARAWAAAVAAWKPIDTAAAAAGSLAEARVQMRAVLAGDALAGLTQRIVAASVDPRDDQAAGAELEAALAASAVEPGALEETLAAQLERMERDLAAKKAGAEPAAIALVLRLAGEHPEPAAARDTAVRLLRERGEAVLAPLGDELERLLAEDAAQLATHPTVDGFDGDAHRRRRALAAGNPFAPSLMTAAYSMAEGVRARLQMLTAALTARSGDRPLAEVLAAWAPPYGPLKVQPVIGAVVIESARSMEGKPHWLRVGPAPVAMGIDPRKVQ